MKYRAIIHASELLTGAGFREKNGRRIQESDLGRIEDGSLVYSVVRKQGQELPGKIVWVGKTSELPKKFSKVKKTNLHRKKSLVPGFVDCHTHLIFAGNRAEDFAARCGGATYEEIAKKGGGILRTVNATRAASEKELEKLAIERVIESRGWGVKTLEIKTGYGLSVESELKCLRVAKKLKTEFPDMTFRITFMAAHAFPEGVSQDDYIHSILKEMLPVVAKKKLADACDIFVDRGYFSIAHAKEILSEAKKLGLQIKLHGDELVNTESAAFGSDIQALSVDHLLKISEKGIQALARSETVAVLLPGTAFYLKEQYAPARKLLDAGAIVALSTDFNPGTCMCNSLPIILSLGALYLQMSRAELLASVTYNAAKALGLEKNKGTLEKGKDADFTVIPFPCFEETYYRLGWKP